MPPRYTDEFKIEAVKQVTDNGYSIPETAERLGVHKDSLRSWIKGTKNKCCVPRFCYYKDNK